MSLLDRLSDKTAVIGVVGLGYVGLPLAIRYTDVGYKVIGFDIDPAKAEKINAGETYIKHIPELAIQRAVENGFEVTSDFSKASDADALIICVPTPLNSHREPDLSFVINTLNSLCPYLREEQIVSLESTTYPGTTEEELRPRIESTDLIVGKDIFLVYSPEREDPGNEDFPTQAIPKVCGGTTELCLKAGIALYDQIIEKVVPVSSTKVAEMTKLLENIHRSVNIGLVNEMKIVADKMGIDIYEVIDAAATKPFGFVPYYPGPGLGGHCIPIDPFYLTWKAREYGVNTRFIELAGEINSYMPQWVANKVAEGLNADRKSVNGSRILVLGIAYKKNVDDMRGSPALEIMQLLKCQGGQVEYSDPHVPIIPRVRDYQINLHSVELSKESIGQFDCVVLVADHNDFDYELIRQNARLIIDTRGRFRTPDKRIIRC